MKSQLYHIHRKHNFDIGWEVGKELIINDDFETLFFMKLQLDEYDIIRRVGNKYDIDYVICLMEELKFNNQIEESFLPEFNRKLRSFYLLRREQALEEGRLKYNPKAPSRAHALFLMDEKDINYWKHSVGGNNYDLFLLDLDGNIFVSSDTNFPDPSLFLEKQVKESEKYWQPINKSLIKRREYLFQGKTKILSTIE